MIIDHSTYSAASPPTPAVEVPECRTVASYERNVTIHRRTETDPRSALARAEALIRQKDEVIQQ